MARTADLLILPAESGLTRYFEEIRRFPMLERQQEYMLDRPERRSANRRQVGRRVRCGPGDCRRAWLPEAMV
jgi:hypothetical protein